MIAAHSVLVVDDDPALRRMLRTSLGAEGWRVLEAANGHGAITEAARSAPDVVLLDLGLPDLDGMEVLRRLRAASAVPVVVLTVRDDEASKVTALDSGADDYVSKPFGIAELTARLRAALRHRLQQDGAAAVFASGEISIDLVRRSVMRAGAPVHLSPREYDILAMLAKHAGQVLTHRQILGELWGATGDVQQLRVYVRQLRQKIEENPERPRHILTETGVGYRLAVDE